MDASEQYINMCRKAIELQENHVWQDGDFIIVHGDVLTVLGDDTITSLSKDLYEYTVCGEVKKLTALKQPIWLPRIDQLIEMAYIPWEAFAEQCSRGDICAIRSHNDSFEMAALRWIMEDKFNKKWNGEDWI